MIIIIITFGSDIYVLEEGEAAPATFPFLVSQDSNDGLYWQRAKNRLHMLSAATPAWSKWILVFNLHRDLLLHWYLHNETIGIYWQRYTHFQHNSETHWHSLYIHCLSTQWS